MIDLLGYIVSVVYLWGMMLFIPFIFSVWVAEKYISKIFEGVYEPEVLRKILGLFKRKRDGYCDTMEVAPVFYWALGNGAIVTLLEVLSAVFNVTHNGNGTTTTTLEENNIIDALTSSIHSDALSMSFYVGSCIAGLVIGLILHFAITKLIEIRKQATLNAQEMAKCRAIVLGLAERKSYVMTGEQLDALRGYMAAFGKMQGSDNLDLNEKFNQKRNDLFRLRVIPID